MKRIYAVTVFVAVLGIFGFVACGGNDEKNFEKVLSGNITISPTTAFTGEELTATYSGSEKVNYQWNKDETAISGKTDQKFTPTEAGSYTVTVSLAGYNSKTSEAVTVTALLVIDSDYNALRTAINPIAPAWIAMIESNNAIRMANFRVPDTDKGVV